MINLYYIFWGFINLLKYKLRLLSKNQRELYSKRLDICLNCDYLNKENKTCSICGCYVEAKTKVDYYLDKENKSIGGCPKKYW